MKIISRIFFLTVILLFPAVSSLSQDIRVGVVEFEEKNDIGLVNAGTIIAEWVVTEIAAIGKFEVEERLMLSKVLEEQKLILSGVIDESQAAEIGQVYAVDAIITGSCMMVGDSISVTGKIIDVGSGKVRKTAKIEVSSINDLEGEIRILANNLCDISREEFTVQQAIAEKAVFRADIGGGASVGYPEGWDLSLGLSLFVGVNHEYFQVWIEGVPLGYIMYIQGGAVFNVFHWLGLGASIGETFDDYMDYIEMTNVLFGFVIRPRKNIEFGLMTGGTFNTTLSWGQTYDGEAVHVDGSFWDFMRTFETWISFRIIDELTILGKFLHFGAEYDLSGYSNVVSQDFYNNTNIISVMVLYSFSI